MPHSINMRVACHSMWCECTCVMCPTGPPEHRAPAGREWGHVRHATERWQEEEEGQGQERGGAQVRGGGSSDVLHCGQEPEAEERGGELAVSERGGEALAEL